MDVGFGFAIAIACCLLVIPYGWIIHALWRGARSAPLDAGSGNPVTQGQLVGLAVRGLLPLCFLCWGTYSLVSHHWFYAVIAAVLTAIASAIPALALYVHFRRRWDRKV